MKAFRSFSDSCKLASHVRSVKLVAFGQSDLCVLEMWGSFGVPSGFLWASGVPLGPPNSRALRALVHRVTLPFLRYTQIRIDSLYTREYIITFFLRLRNQRAWSKFSSLRVGAAGFASEPVGLWGKGGPERAGQEGRERAQRRRREGGGPKASSI